MAGDFHQFFAYLRQVSPLSQDAISNLSSITTAVEIRKNDNLQEIGQTCKTIYFVFQGIARIYYFKDGKDITEYFAFDNDVIIRAESLFSGKPSPKAIQALEDTTFLAIPSNTLFELFDQYHEIERLFRKIVERSYVDTVNRLESLQFHTAEERYKKLLEKAPNLILDIPLKHIASYLGITQVSLSRIRAGLDK